MRSHTDSHELQDNRLLSARRLELHSLTSETRGLLICTVGHDSVGRGYRKQKQVVTCRGKRNQTSDLCHQKFKSEPILPTNILI